MLDKFDDLDELDSYLRDTVNSKYFEFNDESIDLAEVCLKVHIRIPDFTGKTKFQEFKELISRIIIFRYDCYKVFFRARAVIIDNKIKRDSFALIGLKQYLHKEVSSLRKKLYFFGIPIYSSRFIFDFPTATDKELITLVVDSLVLSIIKKRRGLDQGYANGGRYGIEGEIIEGFELVCDWVDRGLPINPANNEYIEIINQELLD